MPIPADQKQEKPKQIQNWVETPCDECGKPYFLRLSDYNTKIKWNGNAPMRHAECARKIIASRPLLTSRKHYDYHN